MTHQFPNPRPVVLKVRLSATPLVILHTNNATLQLQPFVEVLAVTSNSAFQSLFSLNVVSEVGWEGLALEGWLTCKETLLSAALSSPALSYPYWPSCSFSVPGYSCLRTFARVIPCA